MALLPSFFILQSGSKYLSLTENVPPNVPSGFLKFDEEQIWSPRVKFAAEPAKTGDGRYFHIRSLYNNKYLVKKNSWIVASARKPEEDTSKDSCTLFEPFSLADDQPKSVRLCQVLIDDDEKKRSAVVTLSASSSDEGMLQVAAASSSSSSSGSVFSVIDRASLVVLPSHVVFKNNDLYMRAYRDGYNWLRFDSGFNIADPLLAKELIPIANGNYRIKDLHWGKLFKWNNSWIWADSDENIKDTEFSFVHIKDNVFAIRSLGNNHFCGPLTADNKIRCLNAWYAGMTPETWLIVEERVLRRDIFDIEYRLPDVNIHGEHPYAIGTIPINNDTGSELTSTLNFIKAETRTTNWTNSLTTNFGVTVSMTVQVVPVIVQMGIEMRFDRSRTYEWGVSETTTTSTEVGFSIPLPPGRYDVTYMATMGTCDIPFNYTQRDLLTTGQTVVKRMEDGLYTCTNNYNFHYTVQPRSDETTTTTALPDAADVRG